MAKTPPIHYIVFPDKSWIDADGYKNYPAEHRMKLDGCACMTEKDFKSGAYLSESWWNPVKLGVKIEIPRKRYIVWRHVYKTGNVSTSHLEAEEWDKIVEMDKKQKTTLTHGGACLLEPAENGDQAELLGAQDNVWFPVDPETIRHNQAMLNEEKARLRGHYPEAW